jgi:hypothetical protein
MSRSEERARRVARKAFEMQMECPDRGMMVLVHAADPNADDHQNIAEAMAAMRAFTSEYERLEVESN